MKNISTVITLSLSLLLGVVVQGQLLTPDSMSMKMEWNVTSGALEIYVIAHGSSWEGHVDLIQFTLRSPLQGNALPQFGLPVNSCENLQFQSASPEQNNGFSYHTFVVVPPVIVECMLASEWTLLASIPVTNTDVCNLVEISDDLWTHNANRMAAIIVYVTEYCSAPTNCQKLLNVIPGQYQLGPVNGCAMDCLQTPGGNALPGSPCDDGNINTIGEVWTNDCLCEGSLLEGPPYFVTIQGHIDQCSPAIAGGMVTIQTVQGTQPPATLTVPLNENCYYNTTVQMNAPTGWFQVSASCMNGMSVYNSGQYSVTSGAATTLVLDLACDAEMDCSGVVNGNAYLDDCGACVGGTTGLLPCTTDCVAAFEIVQATNGGALVPFTFTIVNNSTGTGTLTYSWDNIPSTDAEPTHEIATQIQEVAFDLCLTITDASGCSSTHCETVYVDLNGIIHPDVSATCVANFSAMQTAPFSVALTNTSTGFGLYNAMWSLPNGQTFWGDQLSYTFNAQGAYEFCLTPHGFGCQNVQLCQTVYVDLLGNVTMEPSPLDCQAGYWVIQAYEGGPNTDPQPIPYQLWVYNLSTGSGGFQLLWDFGDGSTSTEAFPTHVYAGTGPYDLCLTIWDANGCTDTYCDEVSVNSDGIYNGFGGGDGFRANLTVAVQQAPISGITDAPGIADLKAWPNPVNDILNVTAGSTFQGHTTVTITDMSGRMVRSMDRTFHKGTNNFQIPVLELVPGMYMLRLENGTGSYTYRFVRN